jgi:hypothetical protein
MEFIAEGILPDTYSADFQLPGNNDPELMKGIRALISKYVPEL